MTNEETILSGGTNADSVVKIGNTVHRSKTKNFEFIHLMLLWLEKHGCSYAPKFLGIDEQGREMLSYLEGEVPREIPMTFAQKVNAIKILRQFHDTLAGTKFAGAAETVCHHDFAPWNIIIHKRKVVGMIDFDEVGPGKRIDDVTYFIWTALDLGIAPVSDKQQIKNIATLAKAYQLTNNNEIITSFLSQQNRILKFRQEVVAKAKDPDKVAFSKGAIKRIRKSMHWINQNKNEIRTAIK